MTLKAKNTFMIVFLAFLLSPFLFLRNSYPFLRFAMFADPIRTQQAEYYNIHINQKTVSSQNAFSVPEDVFQQWAHDYYSKGDSSIFLHKLEALQKYQGQIELLKSK